MLDAQIIKRDFPIFREKPDLVYLDSTATALKPASVVRVVQEYYTQYSANVHRGIYEISEQATVAYESARRTVADFLHTRSANEVIFTRGTTEGLNLLAYTIGRERVEPGSEIVVSIAEHHSNFVPWQQLALENDAVLKVVECSEQGIVALDTVENASKVITPKTAIVALYYVSNVLGTINPVAEICKAIKAVNPETIIIVDAAQAAPAIALDVQKLGCDFLVFSGHKIGGPTGIGVLWGRKELLESMSPFHFGGEMVERVTLEETTYKEAPHKFEAGTPPIAEAIGLAAATRYLLGIGQEAILEHEINLWSKLRDALRHNRHIKLLGPDSVEQRVGIYSLTHDKIHPHDLAQILSADGVCVRAGHHCAMPLHTWLQLGASTRVSLYVYNTEQDIDRFLKGIHKAEKTFL